jgi:endonuclease/exonuclease/phosphatase (EEP) superfamily protein YafD
MLWTILHILLALVAFWLVSGTLLNFSKHPHWYVRGWDFPRTFVAALAAVVAVAYGALFHERWWDWLLLAGLAFVIARQAWLIYPYTPLARKAVKLSSTPPGPETFRLLISNVLMENREHELWNRVVREADPDVVVAVEVDAAWDAALAKFLAADYPHHLRRPQDNYYGMAIYSRLAFEAPPDVRFVVQDDVPSAHVVFKLRDGQRVRLHALHPRPPEPLRDQDSAPRDAELVMVGREIGEHQRDFPTVVCGDLNDVAWSFTTQLFLRLSRLLDPRRGRGPFNSFNAQSRIFRFPLDHVFHSDEFKLVELRVLPYVGSDHFPVFIALSCQPEAGRQAQPESTPTASDHEDAAEILETQAEREQEGDAGGDTAEISRRGGGGGGNTGNGGGARA